MKTYTAGTIINFPIGLQDHDGNDIAATAGAFRVLDHDGEEVLARANITPWVAESREVTVEVSALVNTLAPGEVRGMRMIELFLTTAAGEVMLVSSYALEDGDVLVVPENTFQNYAQAEFTASAMPNITGWADASREARQQALIEARNNICRLRYAYEFDIWQNRVEPTFTEADLGSITLTDFELLPADFVKALRQAQIAEANVILGGDPVEDIRREGLMSKTVGESSQMYRPGKPVTLPMSARAMRILSKYIDWSRKLGRG